MTEKADRIRCQVCGCDLSKEGGIEECGEVFCEDCYFDSHQRIKACDPWAVRSKKGFRERAGLEGTEGLTDIQKSIYKFILAKGGATREEIASEIRISPSELENQFAILRHCELLKGQKREDGVYLVPFEQES